MRVYLDHNATTPLRAEAREAMRAAMDVIGNPSSVHAEGRAAKGLVERARAQVGALVGVDGAEIVFCGSATEAAAQVLAAGWSRVLTSGVEHDCISAHGTPDWQTVALDDGGVVSATAVAELAPKQGELIAIQLANSETGVTQNDFATFSDADISGATAMVDAAQFAGKMHMDLTQSPRSGFALLSAHKIGGPKGVGAIVVPRGMELPPLVKGGGQEMGRRSGTENIIGIAGFGAAAKAAARDVSAGLWDTVAQKRDLLEQALETASTTTISVGKGASRLPNTSCFLTPGWKGETQVMQMDLAGFAISAGSACSSGKVRASTVLRAMGFDEMEAASAIRVSLGLETTTDDVMRFADAWTAAHQKHEARAA